jgi:hypothetical protein
LSERSPRSDEICNPLRRCRSAHKPGRTDPRDLARAHGKRIVVLAEALEGTAIPAGDERGAAAPSGGDRRGEEVVGS